MQKMALSLILFLLATMASAQKASYNIWLQGDTLIGLPGRRVILSPQGFPQQIITSFTADGKDTTGQPVSVLAENIHFHFVNKADGKDIRLKSRPVTFIMKSAAGMSWLGYSESELLDMNVAANMKANGELSYTVRIKAFQDIDLKDIVLHIPFEKGVAKYAVGVGLNGDYHPDSIYHWKWTPENKEEASVWIGMRNSGLRYWLLILSYWSNGGKGGMDIGIKGRSMLASNYSGERQLKKDEIVYYNFTLFVTPPNTPNKIKQ